MIAEPKTDFHQFMKNEILIRNEKNDNPYRLYEHLKRKAALFGIDPETAAKIIVKELEE